MPTPKKFTIVSGNPTAQELRALEIALEEIEKSSNPPKAYRSSWARLKIANSLPRDWGTTAS